MDLILRIVNVGKILSTLIRLSVNQNVVLVILTKISENFHKKIVVS